MTGIEIYRNDYATPVDMNAIHAALDKATIEYDLEEEQDRDRDNMVFIVDTGETMDAVRIINSLGYRTDEDE
jgi:hypothetical protein